MNKAFSHLSFADLSAMGMAIFKKMEWLRQKFPDDLEEMNGDNLTEWGLFNVFYASISLEISERIEGEAGRWMKFKTTDDTKEIIRRSSISWLIQNAKSEQMKAMGISEEALSDAKEVADDLKSDGRSGRANAIHRLIRAFFLSLEDVSFPKIDNG